jgi:drug/metabolite transporter (DMT)-like permease
LPASELNTASVYALLVAIGILGGLGDAWVYNWARSHRAWWMVAACAVHVASVVLFGLLLRWDSRAFSSAFMLSSVVHVLVVVAADVALFGGRPNRIEWLGLLMATVGVVLLEVGREERPHSDNVPPPAVGPTQRDGDHP